MYKMRESVKYSPGSRTGTTGSFTRGPTWARATAPGPASGPTASSTASPT